MATQRWLSAQPDLERLAPVWTFFPSRFLGAFLALDPGFHLDMQHISDVMSRSHMPARRASAVAIL